MLYISAWYMFRFFFFNDTATTEIYTLSLHDALPISTHAGPIVGAHASERRDFWLNQLPIEHGAAQPGIQDRKSTRLNSSHANISYAVFCLKKKKIIKNSISHSRTCNGVENN